jgi:seipin
LKDSAVAPFKFLVSPTAIKAYLSTVLFLLVSSALLTVSTTAYLFFYYKYIPPINFEKNIYLQYGHGGCPFAVTALDHSVLIPQQAYDVEIKLEMPRTPNNLAAGNFMIDLQLLGPYSPLVQPPESLSALLGNISLPKTSGLSILHHSRRPAMLQYNSPIPFLAQNLLYLPLHLLNLRDLDTACLRIPMFELLAFSRGSANVPTHARLEVKSDSSITTGSGLPTFNIPFIGSASAPTVGDLKPRSLQTYTAKISFCARFQGLRYVIYNYRIISFLLFTTLFYISSVVSMALAWAGLTAFFGNQDPFDMIIKREPANGDVKGKKTDDGPAKIKLEEEESTSGGLSESHLSDTPATFPSGSRQPPLQYAGRPIATSAEASQQPLRPGEVADDEDDEGGHAAMEQVWARGREGDSGIGTSLESEGPGLVRRRSGRASGSGSRDRG